jgi:thiol-disulfide isomerase/thioredoxin/YHS domain-containing protein
MRSIKILPPLLLLLLAGVASGDQLEWLESIEQARQLAAQKNKLVLVHFWSTSCGPCVRLEQQVYSQASVAEKMQAHFVMVKINTEVHPAIARQYQIRFVPTDVVMHADGRVLATQGCPTDAARYLAGLSRFAASQSIAGSNFPTGSNVPTTVHSFSEGPGGRTAAYRAALGPRYSQPEPTISREIIPAETIQPVTASASWSQQQRPTDGNTELMAARRPLGGATVAETPLQRVAHRSTDYLPGDGTAAEAYSRYGLPQRAPQRPSPAAPPIARGIRTSPPPVQPPYQPLPVVAPISQQPVIDGMCVVELVENEHWLPGSRRWGAFHRGRLYLFAGEHQQQRFLSNPEFYSPVLSGNDPVLAVDDQQTVAGKRQHGVFYNQRIYLFTTEETLARFYQNPDWYASVVLRAEAAGRPASR